MKSDVRIEWLIETLDGPDAVETDILEVNHRDTYSAALKDQADELAAGAKAVRIGLVRDRGNEDEGVICRSWAYVRDGKLPEYFNDGDRDVAKVPAKYHRELAA